MIEAPPLRTESETQLGIPPDAIPQSKTAIHDSETNPQSDTQAVNFVSADVIDRVVIKIRAIDRTSTLALAIDIGHTVVHELYGGDVQVLRKLGRNHAGYRMLVEHPGLSIGKSKLWRSVRVYELTSRMRWVVSSSLTVAHITAVLGLSPEEQEKRLRMAADEGWSSRRLAEEIRGKTRPVRASSTLMNVVQRVERLGFPSDY